MQQYNSSEISPLFRLLFNPRLVIAGLMVIGALIAYYGNTQVNPVTGEKQRVAMTVEQEIELGQQSAPRMAEEMGGVVDPSSSDALVVQKVGRRVVERSEAGKSPYQFRFHLLRDPKMINAFALPGGQIFITRGLLYKLSNEAQLAGVLGHEIGHVIHRHSAQHLAKGQFGQTITQAVGVAASGGGYDAARMAQAVAQTVNQMKQMQYGRKDESQSDNYGLKIMVEAGFDPRGMEGVMEVLMEASKGREQPEFLSTHPHPESRMVEIRQYLATKYPRGIPKNLTEGEPLEFGAQLRLR